MSSQGWSVALVGPMSGAGRLSMDIYTSALHLHLMRGQTEFRTTITSAAQPRIARRLMGLHGATADAWLGSYITYPRLIKKLKADLVHVTDHSEAHLTTVLDRSRTVITCHDLTPLEIPDRIFPRLPGRMSGKRLFAYSVSFLAQCAAVIADSEATKASLMRHTAVSAGKIHVIPLGVDDVFHEQPNAMDRQGDISHRLREPYVLHVGTAGPQKNLEAVIRVVAAAGTTIPRLTLVKVGEPLRPSQRRLASDLGIGDRIIELRVGGVRELAEIYGGALALVHPSLWEGFGLPVAEAMASGTPALVSNVASLPELVGRLPLSFDPGAYRAMAATLNRLWREPEYRANISTLCRSAARKYDWRRTASMTANVYRLVMGSGQMCDRQG